MDDILLKTSNVSKFYNSKNEKRIILDNLNFTLNQGDKIAVVGANGSGKSTFLKVITNQISVDRGNLFVGVSSDEIVYLPQDYRNSLFPWLNVRSNLSLLLNQSKNLQNFNLSEEIENQVNTLIKTLKVNINLDKYPYQLSGGEQQALLMIYATIKKPKLFIADEPFSAIDYHKKEVFEDFFNRWSHENNITSIIVSHDIDEAVYLSDKILILTRQRGSVKDYFSTNLLYPRNQEIKHDSNFIQIVNYIKKKFE